MTPKQSWFLKTRIHWGSHLPMAVRDGLARLAEDQSIAIAQNDITRLFDALMVLETTRSKDGWELMRGYPEDEAVLNGAMQEVKEIVFPLCGWDK